MPRTARAIVGGYCYHLINRGNSQAALFHEHSDYAAFLSLITETQQDIELPILAACLMPNHVHLVVRPAGNNDLSIWTHRVFTTHVRRHHRKYLVARAEHWHWGSLRWRGVQGSWRIELAKSPVPLPENWVTYVNEPQTLSEVESIRTCINRQRPFGAKNWVQREAKDLGLLQSIAPVGRPRSQPASK